MQPLFRSAITLCLMTLLLIQASFDAKAERSETQEELLTHKEVLQNWQDQWLLADILSQGYHVPKAAFIELLQKGYQPREILILLEISARGGKFATFNRIMDHHYAGPELTWLQTIHHFNLHLSDFPDEVQELILQDPHPLRPSPPKVHSIPDIRPGILHDLKKYAYSPTLPSNTLVRRFSVPKKERANLYEVLKNPLAASPEMLLKHAGKELRAGDWVMATILATHKPFPVENILVTRQGYGLSWSEIVISMGFQSDILTQGAFSGIYPILTGVSPDTILIARAPKKLTSYQPFHPYGRHLLSVQETEALIPIIANVYRATPEQKSWLRQNTSLDLFDKTTALYLSGNSKASTKQLEQAFQRTRDWAKVLQQFQIDPQGLAIPSECILEGEEQDELE